MHVDRPLFEEVATAPDGADGQAERGEPAAQAHDVHVEHVAAGHALGPPGPGQSVTADGLTAFLGGQLAAFKVPQQVWISSEPLPRLGTEKIDKVSLRKDYREIWAKAHG